jgi:hypothetical protein
VKPVIQREIDEIRRLIADLESRLRNERVELGHRVVFDIGRKGEVPAPTQADLGRVLTPLGWATITGSGGPGSTTPDGHTTSVVTGVLTAEPLSGTINARFRDLSGTIDGHFNALGASSSPDGTTLSVVTGVLNALPLSGAVDGHFNALSGTINARFINLSGTIDGHFNALSGTINSAIVSLSGTIDARFSSLSGTSNSAIVALSGTINSAIVSLSSTLNSAVSGVLNLAFDSYIWSGGRTSYQSGIPLIVGAFRLDPSVVTVGPAPSWSGSLFFLTSAANNGSTIKSYVQLWNVTDGYQVASASFSGTPFVDQVIGLSANGSGNLNVPNSAKDYEVRVFLSGTNGSTPNGASVELYSAGVRVSYRRSS